MKKSIHLFDNSTEATALAAGTTLFEQGSFAQQLYVVIDGAVAIVRNGCEIAVIESGGVVGEMAILAHRPHYASAIAKSPCQVVAISPQRFRFLVEQTPNFALDMMEMMAERLHLMNEKLC